ncbi:MAG: AAA family ATPase [Bacilli bacterium]|nr:AAA family ATPase [Bacilli bacterium]
MASKIKELEGKLGQLTAELETLDGVLRILSGKTEANKSTLIELDKELAVLRQQVEDFRKSIAAAAVSDAKEMLNKNAQNIINQNFGEMVRIEREAIEKVEQFSREISSLRSKIDSLYKDVKKMAETVVSEEIDKVIHEGLSKRVSTTTLDLLTALIGEEARKEVDAKLDIIEREAGIERKEVYSIAIGQAVDSIASSIASSVLSKLNVTTATDTPSKPIEPFDREKELVHEKFDKLRTCVEAGIIPMLVGPAGTGKSTAVEQVARAMGLPFYTMNRIQNSFDLTGYNDANGRYVSTQFYEAYTKGGIFFFDEIDASSPEALVTINTALAQGYMAFPNGLVKMHPDFKVVAAGNTYGKGANRQYCGRNSLDSATLDRFMIIEWDYDRKLEAKIIKDKELLEFAWAVRDAVEVNKLQIIISTRGIKATSKIIEASAGKEGFSLVESLEGNLFENVKVDTLNQIIEEIRRSNKMESNRYFKALVELKTKLESNKR